MSLTPFVAVQSRLNSAVQSRLANATATYQGGVAFGVLFDRTPADPFGGAVDTSAFTVAYCIANTPGINEGCELVIDGVPYVVNGPVQPDAGGWVVLLVYPKG